MVRQVQAMYKGSIKVGELMRIECLVKQSESKQIMDGGAWLGADPTWRQPGLNQIEVA